MKLQIATIPAIFVISLLAVLTPAAAFAQTTSAASGPMIPACISFTTDIHYGANDMSSQPWVTNLQQFLSQHSFFSSSAIGTGHFGPLTLSAVKQFQAAEGVPATGFVGPLTRAAINRIGCSTTTPPVTTNAAQIYSISPNSGATGSTASITGFGFTNSNTILFDGMIVARDVPITSSMALACTTSSTCHGGINQTLQFTVPTSIGPNCQLDMACPMYVRLVTPGTYQVTIQNDNGTSNAVNYTVTAGGTSFPQPTPSTISVQSLSAPSTLTVGSPGTWTVNATASSNSGNLTYSVVWGDEGQNAATTNAFAIPKPTTVQNSATFTHTYQLAGTYTPVFTITDSNGNSVTTSNTLTVTPLREY